LTAAAWLQFDPINTGVLSDAHVASFPRVGSTHQMWRAVPALKSLLFALVMSNFCIENNIGGIIS